jgi:hypothetical protein
MDAVKQPDVDLIAILATQYLKGTVLNQPIRAGGDSFAVEIGHRWYADAKRQTQALDF